MTTAEAVKVFADKAPVFRPGSQRAARYAFQFFSGQLNADEHLRLSVAISHALDCGEGRGEFDRVMTDLRKAHGW